MIYALYLYGLAILLGLAASALSALQPQPGGRHRFPGATPEPWAASLGPGWRLRMNGDAEYVPRRLREEPKVSALPWCAPGAGPCALEQPCVDGAPCVHASDSWYGGGQVR